MDLLLSGVTLFVGGRELLWGLLDSLSLVRHLDLSLSLSVRLVEGSLVEGSGGRRKSVRSLLLLLLVGVMEVVSVRLSGEHGGLLSLSDELLLELLSLLVDLKEKIEVTKLVSSTNGVEIKKRSDESATERENSLGSSRAVRPELPSLAAAAAERAPEATATPRGSWVLGSKRGSGE